MSRPPRPHRTDLIPTYHRHFTFHRRLDNHLEWYLIFGPSDVEVVLLESREAEATFHSIAQATLIQSLFRGHLCRRRARQALAASMALHPRLGEGSGLACLGEDLLRHILGRSKE